MFVIVSHFKDGWEVLQAACNKTSETANIQDIIEVMEAFLCFHAWLKSDKMWPLDEADWYKNAAQTSIRELMRMFINRVPREKGEGWNLLKTHLLLHFVDEIAKFGVPKNHDTERPEHNHLHNVKHPGCRADKSYKSFECSFAQRVADTFIINAMDKEINGRPKKAPQLRLGDMKSDDEAEDIISGTNIQSHRPLKGSLKSTGVQSQMCAI